LELPKYDVDDTIIRHRGYTLSYNSKYKQANWVAYLLTREETAKLFQRGEFFAPDPLISGTDFKIDYLKSGYDRGHLAPAADMGYSMETMVQSFFYSNMSPQVPRFNRGVWKKLEMQGIHPTNHILPKFKNLLTFVLKKKDNESTRSNVCRSRELVSFGRVEDSFFNWKKL
jgi:DNA/RNA endonuclease G (NUC1)